MTYAVNTQVSSEKSRMEIERTLARYGATGFLYGWHEDSAVVAFQMCERHIKFVLPLPRRADRAFTHTPSRGTARSGEAAAQAYEQAVRQKWRALALCIKAKLEAVESEITEFESEFLAHIVMPDGKTVGEHLVPQIGAAYGSGKMPPLLPHFGDGG